MAHAFASDGSHLSGAMIALLPSAADAKRLAVKGGEAADDLHLTLYYLGPDATAFSPTARQEMTGALMMMAAGLPEITANVFGVAHWNAGSDDPSWVWSVGDARPLGESGPPLEAVHSMACDAVWMTSPVGVEIPGQHTPWVAHICAAYTDDLTLAKTLEQGNGPVVFDRIRITFGDDTTDIPLGVNDALTAAGALHRLPTDMELSSKIDFAMVDKQWKSAVAAMLGDYRRIESDQRAELREQITAAVDGGNLLALDTLSVSTDDTTRLLFTHMKRLARLAGEEVQREAEHQGVHVPPWDLDTALTASTAMDVLTTVSRVTARSMGLTLVQSAGRRVMQFIGLDRSGRDVAADVDTGLKTLSDSGPKDAVSGAMSAAQNAGRIAVLSLLPEAAYLATEALDKNTCKPCVAIDGTEFGSLFAAREAYPSGGYSGCAGGFRCRGTMIAVWGGGDVASAAVQEEGMSTATENLGGKPNQGTKKDKRLSPNKYDADTVTDDLKADTDAAAPALEDGYDPVAWAASLADNGGCPPGMELDPGTGECAPPPGAAAEAKTAPWRGVLVVEGEWTGDGRKFATDALTYPEDPEPGEMVLRWNIEDSHGGAPTTKAVAVGRIDKVWREGGLIMGEGVFDLGQPNGVEAHRRVGEGFLRGISIDADDIGAADIEFVWPDNAADGSDEDDIFNMMFAQPEGAIYHSGRIRAATLCDIPAFPGAWVALIDDEGAVVAGGQTHPELVQHRPVRKRTVDGLSVALVAHGGQMWKPPAEWFTNPQLSMPVGIQVTDEGRVYGHAAQWGTCHIGQTGTCVQPPREDGHPYFMTGEVPTTDGAPVAVGQITVHTGHPSTMMKAAPAAEHYDNTGYAVADVAVGNDSHGIWVAGAIRPNADPLLVHELRASGQVSGDWRRIGGKLRLVGLLGVNVPGFPVPKMQARVASGEVQSLIAAGQLTVSHGLTADEVRDQAYKIVMDDLFRQINEGSE